MKPGDMVMVTSSVRSIWHESQRKCMYRRARTGDLGMLICSEISVKEGDFFEYGMSLVLFIGEPETLLGWIASSAIRVH